MEAVAIVITETRAAIVTAHVEAAAKVVNLDLRRIYTSIVSAIAVVFSVIGSSSATNRLNVNFVMNERPNQQYIRQIQ